MRTTMRGYGALYHHGIKGQKWGVIRTPEQLGHAIKRFASKGTRTGDSTAPEKPKHASNRSDKRTSEISDEELRQRIQRLNMEEQYENLVQRQKERHTGPVKKMLSTSLESAANKLTNKAMDAALEKLFDRKGNVKNKFNINEWKNADVDSMDLDTIKKVSAWHEAASKIEKHRSAS